MTQAIYWILQIMLVLVLTGAHTFGASTTLAWLWPIVAVEAVLLGLRLRDAGRPVWLVAIAVVLATAPVPLADAMTSQIADARERSVAAFSAYHLALLFSYLSAGIALIWAGLLKSRPGHAAA